MRRIDDAPLIQALLDKAEIGNLFSAPGLQFHVRQYKKGEILCSPVTPLDHFLLLMQGSVYVYDLQNDGNRRSISLENMKEIPLFGDLEFATEQPTPFFAEVVNDALCLALPMVENAAALWDDPVFLRYLMRALAQKIVHIDISALTVEEQVLHLMKRTNGALCISSVKNTAIRLQCSSRHLLRVLKKFCEDGILRKEGKGCYVCNKS